MSDDFTILSPAAMRAQGLDVDRHVSLAARIEFVMDLCAPRDENSVRRPENGLIDAETARRILDRPLR